MGDIARTEKGRSPFSPGRPVPPDMFVGRTSQIDRCMRSAKQTSLGKQENLFIIGEYGIGKSSLVSYIRSAAEEKYALAGFHVLLGGISSIEEMVQHIVSRMIQEAHRGKFLEKLKSVLGKYVESVELFGVTLNTAAIKSDSVEIAHQFLPFLRQVWNSLENDFRGMALFLDDLNGITKVPEFAALIKSLVDEIATGREDLPLMLALSGVQERRLEIIRHQPPVERIFDIVQVTTLTDEEVEHFFSQAFDSAKIKVEEKAIRKLVHYSGGLPKLMHELGEATFWADNDNYIDSSDAFAGVVDAADNVGKKYFEHIRAALESSDYHSILRKLGDLAAAKDDLTLAFNKVELAEDLNEIEQRKLNNFLQRMKSLHALSPGEVRGTWVFPNRLVQFYLLLETIREKGKKTK